MAPTSEVADAVLAGGVDSVAAVSQATRLALSLWAPRLPEDLAASAVDAATLRIAIAVAEATAEAYGDITLTGGTLVANRLRRLLDTL